MDSLAFALSSSPILTSNSWQFIPLMLNLEIAYYTNLLKAPHLKVGRLAFETITDKFRPQKHHWRSHLVRQVCMWCNQVIILQDPVTENTAIFSSCSRDHVPLWSWLVLVILLFSYGEAKWSGEVLGHPQQPDINSSVSTLNLSGNERANDWNWIETDY